MHDDLLPLDQVADPQVREALRRLMNLVEVLSAENQRLRIENQHLKDEINRLKGEQGRPKPPRGKQRPPPSQHSSEAERHEPTPHRKGSKRNQIVITRTETRTVDRTTLPPDAVFKGHATTVIQDLTIAPDNVCFRSERWHLPSARRTIQADLPPGYHGQFGPTIHSLIWIWYFASQMSEAKIVELLHHLGVQISTGHVATILLHRHTHLHAEAVAVAEAALASSPWQQIDDTSTRVNGVTHHCHVVSTPLATVYHTLPRKTRLSALDALRNQRPRVFCWNDHAEAWLATRNLSPGVRRMVDALPRDVRWSTDGLAAVLNERLPTLGTQQRAWIEEALALGAYQTATDEPVVRMLVCDDAPQFAGLTANRAGCWVHDARYYKKLRPCLPAHFDLLTTVLDDYWALYRRLRTYRDQPSAEEAAAIRAQFTALTSHVTGYDDLDACLRRTAAHHETLLQVLDHPEIPLHNNAAELACRARVRKRLVSFGPRTAAGVRAWDVGMTLIETAKKVGVNAYAYLRDRITATRALPSLADCIRAQAPTLALGASWGAAHRLPAAVG